MAEVQLSLDPGIWQGNLVSRHVLLPDLASGERHLKAGVTFLEARGL